MTAPGHALRLGRGSHVLVAAAVAFAALLTTAAFLLLLPEAAAAAQQHGPLATTVRACGASAALRRRADGRVRRRQTLPPGCSLYLATMNGQNGIGDQLTRYLMAVAVASQFRAGDPVARVSALVDRDGFVASPTHENGADEYAHAVQTVLGLRHVHTVNATRRAVKPLTEVVTSPLHAARAALAACASSRDVLLLLNPDDCPRWRNTLHRLTPGFRPSIQWCPTDARVPGLDSVGWQVRADAAAAVARAVAQPLPFYADDALNVAIHVRNGDICIGCDPGAPDFVYITLLAQLDDALAGCATRLVFFAQYELPWVHAARPGARVVTATTPNASVSEVMAHFLGANVFVTSGSSFPLAVAAFAPVFRPLVLESMNKEAAVWGCHGRGCPGVTHVLQRGTSFRLDRQGRMMDVQPAELRAALRAAQPEAWARACPSR